MNGDSDLDEGEDALEEEIVEEGVVICKDEEIKELIDVIER